jgi:hypothetical protein
MATLDDLRALLADGETVQVRMRGGALEPLVADGALLELVPSPAGHVGDLVVATVDGVARLRCVVVREPGGHRVLLGGAGGPLVQWSDPDSVTGRVATVDGRRWEHPRRRRRRR